MIITYTYWQVSTTIMVRVKNTAKILQNYATLAKKTKNIVDKAKGLVRTGKLKVPFKAAVHAKKGLIKQLKRRQVFTDKMPCDNVS